MGKRHCQYLLTKWIIVSNCEGCLRNEIKRKEFNKNVFRRCKALSLLLSGSIDKLMKKLILLLGRGAYVMELY